jgi:tetratricopeptide (TPR) repeat protein
VLPAAAAAPAPSPAPSPPPPLALSRAAPPTPPSAAARLLASDDEATGDHTRRIDGAGSAGMIDAVLELLASESEALLTERGGADDQRLAELNVRLALAATDVLDDADAGIRYLELADRHPLTARLRLGHGAAAGDRALLDAAGAALERGADPVARARGRRDLAEVWLYGQGAADRALAVLAATEIGDAELAGELRELTALARAAAGAWRDAADAAFAEATAADATAELLAQAQALALDRLGQPARAAELTAAVLAGDHARGPALHWLRALDLALEANARAPGARPGERVALLERRVALLVADGAAPRAVAAARYQLADAHRAAGDLGAALAGYRSIAVEADFGAILAHAAAASVAILAGRWADAVAALHTLATASGLGVAAGAYAWRAFELAGAHGLPALELGEAALAHLRGPGAVRQLEAALLGGPAERLVATLTAGQELRRAALVVELRVGDLTRATELARVAAAARPPAERASELDLQLRLARRRHERGELAELHRAAAATASEAQVGAAHLTTAGLLELARGRFLEAEEAFLAAGRRATYDPAAKVALAAIYRKAERWSELSTTLTELAALLVSPTGKAAVLREHGALLAGELGDLRQARAVLEQAQALAPDDLDTAYELARLYEHGRQWDQAIAMRLRIAERTSDRRRAAELHLEIGQLEETQRSDDVAALAAYETAARLDERGPEPLRAQAALHRKHGRTERLIAVLVGELERGVEPSRRVAVQLELGRLRAAAGDPAAAVASFTDALSIEPEHEAALAGLADAGRAAQDWRAIADGFRRAPRTLAHLHVLAEALERLEEWTELSAVRQAELAEAPVAERPRLAAALARMAEDKLGDVDTAIRFHALAAQAAPTVETQRDLSRLLERAGRWPELAAALERELAATPSVDTDAQIAVLLRLGELRDQRLGKPLEAAQAYEAVLERSPHHGPSLEALERLYEQAGRDKDLLRVLELRADACADKVERAQLQLRIAAVRQARGDIDGAIAASTAAFVADPGNREVFTALEKLCYKHERWPAAMHLYQTAIDLIEGGQSRAYRLSDLYARRGQVQLQYLGEADAAAASYARVIEIDPDNDTSVKFLESIYAQKNDWSGLLTIYEKRASLIRDDERRLEALRRAARVAAAKMRDFAEAARLYQQVLDAEPGDPEALDALERWYERNQEWGKLVEVLRKRLATAPVGDAATAILRRIAQISEDGLRDEGKATEHYQRILEIAPTNKDALEALGRIYESTEQWAEFVDVTRRQIRVTTDRNLKALLYFKCGSVMEAKFGKEEDAIRYYDAAIKTSPSCLPAVHGLRDLYRRREDWPRVIQTLELEVKLWQDDKERAGVFAQIGRIYEQRLADPSRAMHYYESALAVDPECLPANQALFEHFYDARQWAKALPLAQALAVKAMRDGDPNTRSEFYRRRGVVQRETGDLRGAAESLIVALEIKPTNLEALDHLLELQRARADAWDFESVFRELDKLYKKRDDAGPLLARVKVAQAAAVERDGDLDTAQAIYAEAVALAPDDFAVLSARITLDVNLRRWNEATLAITRFVGTTPPPPLPVHLAALMRQAEIHADGEMDAKAAIAVLREVIRLDPSHEHAYYLLAQEHFALGRYAEAKAAIDRVIELAAAPGSAIAPESLSRYYYYRGRITEVGGDARGATSQYRRACEYDPGYAPPALALARRAADAGDRAAAETLLIDAAHAAMEKGGPIAAVPLQRGLARILLSAGERAAAIEAYRGILGVDDSPADRVALAEIYAIDDPAKAVSELRKVLERTIHHAPVYRLLAAYYLRLGEISRAVRSHAVMSQLGFAEDADRAEAAHLRPQVPFAPVVRSLDDDLRQRVLVTAAAREVFGEILAAAPDELAALYPTPFLGENLLPVQRVDDPALRAAIADVSRLTGVEAEVFLGERVPGLVAMVATPRKLVVIDRTLIGEADGPRRYLLGWAFEALRGGYAFLHHLGKKQRSELGGFVKSLLLPESERPGPTNEFVRGLPKRAQRVIERHTGGGRELDGEAWIDGMLAIAKRGGLVACDDFFDATWMIARISGEMLLSHDATVALGAVLGGADLIRFYLSDDYQRIRETLTAPL